MKKSYWASVMNVIRKSDIVLYLLDARFTDESRNSEVERMLMQSNKKTFFVFTKYDLVKDNEIFFDSSLKPNAFVSSISYYGMNKLKEMIIIEGKRVKKARPKIGVVGYPNIGKSSLINALGGRGKAITSKEPGMTKGMQYISAGKFLLIDTPGVIPRHEKNEESKHMLKHIKIFAKSAGIKNPDNTAILLMEENYGMAEHYFGVPVIEDKDATLEEIARKKCFLIKGGKPDIMRAARFVLRLYQEGKFRVG